MYKRYVRISVCVAPKDILQKKDTVVDENNYQDSRSQLKSNPNLNVDVAPCLSQWQDAPYIQALLCALSDVVTGF
jgi:hypothetical protein